MVYFASLDQQLESGGIKSKLKITPIVDQLKNIYYVSSSQCPFHSFVLRVELCSMLVPKDPKCIY